MKKGDQVRFLSETGGGIVAGFQGKNIVLVEDADGFQIPVSITEVVVVNDEQDRRQGRTNTIKTAPRAIDTEQNEGGSQSIKALLTRNEDDDHADEQEPADREITFRKPVEERLGGNKLSLFLAFLPENIKNLSNTRFEVYLINDSNYHLFYTYATAEGQSWLLRSSGELEPNSKLLLERIAHEDVNNIEHTALQAIAYKQEKDYALKPVVDAQLHIEPLKFYKQHLFCENPFFETDALLYPIVENDETVTPEQPHLNADALKESMLGGGGADKSNHKKPSKENRPLRSRSESDMLVVDLHADEILETTQGMEPFDILQYQLEVFRRTLQEHAKNYGQKIIFIHGKGEGVLRKALITELRRNYKDYLYQDASFREYGYGATQVMIKK
jgi:hypothetical protein